MNNTGNFSIDLLIPTFNRSSLIRECLDSVLRAVKPDSLTWRVTVIDNNSRDDTAEAVRPFVEQNPERVRYLFEKRQGKSTALNSGISASDHEFIGMIDDDEHLDENWFSVAMESLADPQIDYIGGPYLPLWRAQRPDWLPTGREGVLGSDDPSLLPGSPVPFDGGNFFLRGGNAIIRRSVLERIGGYSEALGPVGNDHGACEDHEMYDRLVTSGVKGLFVPQLVVHHIVPPERVSRRYFRYWSLRRAESLATMESWRRQNVVYVGRIPRYLIGSAIRALPGLVGSLRSSRRFGAELQWWDLAGFVYGAYLKPAVVREKKNG
jgi:glycosyltransferase involved in cell wall biosynthesis